MSKKREFCLFTKADAGRPAPHFFDAKDEDAAKAYVRSFLNGHASARFQKLIRYVKKRGATTQVTIQMPEMA